jgi:hypothetical protein
MTRDCPLRIDWSKLHIHPEKTSRLAPLPKSGDNSEYGKTLPDQGRIAVCLVANKSTASKNCGGPSENRSQLSSRATASGNQGLCVEKTAQVHRSFRVSATEGEADE